MRTIFVLLMTLFFASTLQAQRRYKDHPRVKIPKEVLTVEDNAINTETSGKDENLSTGIVFENHTKLFNKEEFNREEEDSKVPEDLTACSDKSNELLVPSRENKLKQRIQVENERKNSGVFKHQFKRQDHPLGISGTQKANTMLWIKLFIVCMSFVLVGLIGIVLAYLVLFFVVIRILSFLFIILGTLFGITILTLGTTGHIA